MPSDILRTIIEQKIDIFANAFNDGSNNLFKRNDKLFHPLEYGMYKERCAKELLQFTLNKNIGISDGFLITCNNNISTQCDIILYQKDILPIIDNGISNFFPVESVKGIGEIKSTLSRVAFKDALVKIAENKKLYLERHAPIKSRDPIYDERKEIFSFLICNKLSFDPETIDFDDIYKEIPDIRFRHNMILSLQDGFGSYELDYSKLPPKQLESHIAIGGKTNISPVSWYHSHRSFLGECYQCTPVFDRIDYNNKYQHIIDFLVGVKSLIHNNYEYEFDLVPYLYSNIANVLKDS